MHSMKSGFFAIIQIFFMSANPFFNLLILWVYIYQILIFKLVDLLTIIN